MIIEDYALIRYDIATSLNNRYMNAQSIKNIVFHMSFFHNLFCRYSPSVPSDGGFEPRQVFP